MYDQWKHISLWDINYVLTIITSLINHIFSQLEMVPQNNASSNTIIIIIIYIIY